MPLSPRLLILIVVAWISGVGWYWAHEVILRPSLSVRLPYGFRLLGVSPEGEVLIERTPGGEASGLAAPLELWSLTTGRLARTVLQAGDSLVPSAECSTGFVCVKRDGRFLAVSLETGETIDELPVGTRAAACDVHLGGRILYSTGDDLRLRDPRSRADVWINPRFASWRGIGEGYIVAREARSPGFGTPACGLRISDGQADTRFDHQQPLTRISLGPHGRLAMVSTQGSLHICEAATGLLKWTLPGSITQPEFSTSGEHLTSVWTDREGGLREAKWDAASGLVLSPAPSRQDGAALRHWSPDRRYSVDSFAISRPWLAVGSFTGWQAKIGLTDLSLRWVGMEAATEIRDHSTGHSLGKISHRLQLATVLPDGRGAVAAGSHGIDFYAFPPRRNYRWLAVWAIGPIPVVWILLATLRRRRRAIARSSTFAPALATA